MSTPEPTAAPALTLRRPRWWRRELELVDGDRRLALLRYATARETGQVVVDGGVRGVRRAPRFGAWELLDGAEVALASVRKHDPWRERFTLGWEGHDRLALVRVPNRGRRLLVVHDLPAGAEVGRIEVVGWNGRVAELSLPPLPAPALELTAWTAGLLLLRDQGAAAQQ